jgi:hypothetical protein
MSESPRLHLRAAPRPRKFGIRSAWALALAGALLCSGLAAAATMPIRKLDWSFTAPDPLAATDVNAGASLSSFDLPLRWSNDEGSPLRTVALRMHFRLEAVPDRTWALLLSHASEGGRFSVNGHFIGAIAAESEARHVAWRRPQLLAIDASLLTAGENELLIETSYGPGAHILAGVEVGPLGELWNRYTLQFILDYVSTWSGATMALLTALVFGALWLQRREAISKLLALAAVWAALAVFKACAACARFAAESAICA